MIVHLAKPLVFNGGTIEQVTVRVPPKTGWDANPLGIDQGLWNLMNAVDLPADVVTQFADVDLDAIQEACLEVGSRWNVAATGEFTSHRAYRRAHLRR